MRIGAFSKKHQVTQDAVRFYLEKGLLVAHKRGEQYYFTTSDGEDLETIKTLKELQFSLSAILELMTLKRLSGEDSALYRQKYLKHLRVQQEEVFAMRKKAESLERILQEKIEKVEKEEKKDRVLGIPVEALSILACPSCGEKLPLKRGDLVDHMVVEGDFQCSCGYEAKVSAGVFVYEPSVRTKMNCGRKMQTKEEFLQNSSHTYINHLYQTMGLMMERIDEVKAPLPYMMEMNNCVGFFLQQYLKELRDETTYILVDYDLERILQLKRNLECYAKHEKFLFLCCDYDQLPLKKQSVDLLVDFGMVRNFEKETGKSLLTPVLPLLKEEGSYVASSLYAEVKKSELRPEGKGYEETYLSEKMKAQGLQMVKESSLGPAYQENPEDAFLSGKPLYQKVIHGRKKKRSIVLEAI